MNNKLVASAIVAVLLVAGSLMVRANGEPKSQADPRLDKVIEQNDKILKNQEEILKALGDLRQDILQLRRRSS
jgi:thiamine kinase-like enzyme